MKLLTALKKHRQFLETPTSYDGNAIGQETKFEFNHTKDLVGGWTSKLDMEVMEVAGTVADTEITIC